MAIDIEIKDFSQLSSNLTLPSGVVIKIPEINFETQQAKETVISVQDFLRSVGNEKVSELLKLSRPFHIMIEDAHIPNSIEENELLSFDVECPECHKECKTNMRFINIPFFGEMIVMVTVCDHCGYKSSEVKSGGGVRDRGIKYTLRLLELDDLNRELLKSEQCRLEIPEIGLVLEPGTLGGRLTTIEGLLREVREQLDNSNPILSDVVPQENMSAFLNMLDQCIRGEKFPFKLILDDPSGLSYLQNTYAPENDPELEVIRYQRTDAQDTELGIKDMVV